MIVNLSSRHNYLPKAAAVSNFFDVSSLSPFAEPYKIPYLQTSICY